MARRAVPDLADLLREAIRDSGKPLLEIARAAGIDHSQLSRFMRGERSLTLPTVGRLMRQLGLRVVREDGS